MNQSEIREIRLRGAQIGFLSDIINHCLMDAEMYLEENETQLAADYYKKLHAKAQILDRVLFPKNKKLCRKHRKDGPRKKRRF